MIDIYERLRARLDQMATGYPSTDNGVELRILRQIFTPEDAELFLAMGPDLESAAQVADRLKEALPDLDQRLEDMARRGLLFRQRQEGVSLYRPVPFVVGIYEYQVKNLNPTFLKDISEYYLTALAKTFFQRKTPHLRTIPIETSLDNAWPVAPYDDAVRIIKNKARIAVTECICRKAARLNGLGCNHSLETCLQFDTHADYYVDNGIGRYITQAEALEILKRSEQEGLVLQAVNSQEVEVMCTCCSCCCGMLVALRLFPAPGRAVMSNHHCRLDNELCTGCGTCVPRCPTRALKIRGDTLNLNPARCIGCGLCVSACPTQALALVRKSEDNLYTPPETACMTYDRMSGEVSEPAPGVQ